ncbi:serine/threonine-protein phosphatase 6 regulatory ankyrin repeat subunit C-like isoform X2 [Procambarus clarkii]|uniref:serine/threonine-protein phosphatase 6 regulatory ankyrin repeat subunit C-like isoform X2 n=1 Tax=Procambarus clarkii TaxID=6728 RepID=UPI003743E007
MDHTGATRRHTDSSSQEMDHTGATRRHTDSSNQKMDHTAATRRHTDSSSQEMDHTGATRRHKATQALVAGVVSGDQVLVLAALALGADTSVTVEGRITQEPLCMLSVAAGRGHTHLVPHLLAAGLPVEGSGESSLTPLHWAAGSGHDQVVRQLLSAQAHLQARGLDGVTALHVAAQHGHESCVVTLLGAGADPDSRADDGRSPLHYAAEGNHTGVVQVLLTAAGCDRHAVNKRRKTALHEAARGGGLEATQCLVAAGLDPRARNMEGHTPLDVARLAGRDRVEWWLRKLPRPHPAAGTPTLPRPHPAAGTPTLPRPHPAAGTPTLPRPHPAAGTPTLPRPHSAAGTPTLPRPHPAAGTPTLPRPHSAAGTPTLPRPHSAAGTPTLPRPHPAAGTPTLHLVCWKQCEGEYAALLQRIREGDTGRLPGNIPLVCDGHQQDHTGRTLLHWAAELGLARVVNVLLEVCRVYPHVLTWAGETPADLALRAGHLQVINTLHSYHRSKVEGGPGEMYEQLLGVISLCDDTQQAGQLLWSGASLEPLGCWSVSPLCLAVTSNRCRITTLLLAAGAPLTTTSHGLNLLTLAWCSPDVTPRLQVTITRVFLHVLEQERDKIKELGELGAGVDEVRELGAGVDEVISTIRGEAPWRACWPRGRSVVSLTQLMVQAARAKCTLTCSFLHLAGAQSSLCSKSGASPLHAALDAGHWELAARMVKDMDGSLYVPDPTGRLPTVTLPPHLAHSLEQSIYNKERNKLQDLQEKITHPIDKKQVQEILDVQEILFTSYFKKTTRAKKTAGARGSRVWSTGPQALLVASRSGLQQLIYLLVKVGGLAVDTLVDPTAATTALHQAAAHGKSGCVLLLLSLGAQPLLPDRYGHTPPHLAAMFAHDDVHELLAEFIIEPEPTCRAGTTPQEVRRHFSQYLLKYNIREPESSSNIEHINNDPTKTAMNLLNRIDLGSLVRDLEKTTVEFTMCEAQEVKDEVMKELKKITANVSDEIFRGELKLSGSAADGTRLYCPDEFDVNFVLQELPGVKVKVIQQTEKEVLASGHKLKVKIKTKKSGLHGNNLVTKFYDRVREILKSHTIGDERLSLVPPGLTRTQVGVALSLAWQGSEYPLLLVSVDLVPVVVVPWPEEISRPPLTPDSSQIIQLSNTEDGSWRCSLAATEVEVLQQLEPQERRVFLTCKTLLSRLKAEPWMPRHVKNIFSWWDSRYWKVPTPAGFCLKNSFLRKLQRKREQGIDWQEKDILILVRSVFRDMCHDPSTGVKSLVPAKVNAYFGGDCEKPKMGEGAPEIVGYLDTLS